MDGFFRKLVHKHTVKWLIVTTQCKLLAFGRKLELQNSGPNNVLPLAHMIDKK